MMQQVFISYHRENRTSAERVRDALRSWGYATWYDLDNCPPDSYFLKVIQEGLEASQIAVGILTRSSLNSRDTLDQWTYALGWNIRLILLGFEAVELPDWLTGVSLVDCTTDEGTGLNQLRQILNQSETIPTPPTAAPHQPRRQPAEEPVSYHPPRLKDDVPFKRRRRIAIGLLIVILLIAIFSTFLDDKTLSVIAIVVALIPAIYALMPESPALEDTPRAGQPIDNNRAVMLYKVYQSWIEGVLKPNLPAGEIDLELSLQPNAVLRHVDYGDYRLPPSSRSIDRIFADMHGELIILGEPGSGKTILMLQLAHLLLGRAQQDHSQPIPLIFNLASWSKDQKPLVDWLADELRLRYDITDKWLVEGWINGRIALFLDGLDEIAPASDFMPGTESAALDEAAVKLRSACIDAINHFRGDHPQSDLVVCSRIRDYAALQHKLNLNAAILLADLTERQISSYLEGDHHQGIRDMLKSEPEAAELAHKPLLLSIMKISYAGIPYQGSPHYQLQLSDSDIDNRYYHLLRVYVDQRLLIVNCHRYIDNQTFKSLSWLGWQMLRRKKSLFYVEELQPDWAINSQRYRKNVRIGVGLTIGLTMGLTSFFNTNLNESLVGSLIVGLIVGLSFGVLFMLIIGPFRGLGDIQFSEQIFWVFPTKWEFLGWLIMGISIGAVFSVPINRIDIGLVAGLIGGITVGIVSGLSQKHNTDIRISPNSRLKRSLGNGTAIGLIIGLLVGVPISLVLTIDYGLVAGLIIGLVAGLGFGIHAVIQHIGLQLALSSEQVIPRWRYDKFLDYAAEIGLLRKVGGGYIFRHRLLMDYFAQEYEKQRQAGKPSLQAQLPAEE